MTFHEYDGVRVETDHDVYKPHDDSHLLADVVRELPPGRLLEVGTGTALVAIHAARAGHDVVATDVRHESARLARANASDAGLAIDLVQADLLAGVDATAFDVVVFNAPYLPTTDEERFEGPLNAAFDGGPDGIDVATRFLDQLPADGPDVYLVISSRQDLETLEARVREAGRTWEQVAKAKVMQEWLGVVRWGVG